MNDDYATVTLNGFLLNAGVVGLLRLLEYANEYDGGCIQGEDYIIEGQQLHLSKKYLLEHDFADLYVRSMVHYLGPDTKYERILGKQSYLSNLYIEPKPEDGDWKKQTESVFEEFIDMLKKPSLKSGYEILSNYEDVEAPTVDMATTLKKEKDYLKKKELYDHLCSLLERDKVREVLIFKELMYSKINMFIEGVGFFNKQKIKEDITETYRAVFINPMIEEFSSKRARNKVCIDCGGTSEKSIAISFLVDFADDLGRKKSYYWNCNPDAYLCPMCAFVCSLAPLGFIYLGRDAVFVNCNNDIMALAGWTSALREMESEESKKDSWYKLYNAFTSEKIEQAKNRIKNLQVIIRETENAHYKMNTIDKTVVSILENARTQLKFLRNRIIKDDKDYINVYQNTVDNIVNRRSQYQLITKLLRVSLKNDTQAGELFNLLEIQIISKGGSRMAENIKRAYVAKKQGEAMRIMATSGAAVSDRENKLRGLVYQLLNAVSLGNRDSFMNLIIRTYSSYGQPVPDIFFACFNSEEDFKEIGFAYIFGLKSEGYKKEEATAQ